MQIVYVKNGPCTCTLVMPRLLKHFLGKFSFHVILNRKINVICPVPRHAYSQSSISTRDLKPRFLWIRLLKVLVSLIYFCGLWGKLQTFSFINSCNNITEISENIYILRIFSYLVYHKVFVKLKAEYYFRLKE